MSYQADRLHAEGKQSKPLRLPRQLASVLFFGLSLNNCSNKNCLPLPAVAAQLASTIAILLFVFPQLVQSHFCVLEILDLGRSCILILSPVMVVLSLWGPVGQLNKEEVIFSALFRSSLRPNLDFLYRFYSCTRTGPHRMFLSQNWRKK